MEEEGRSSSLVSAELPSQSPASPPLLTEGAMASDMENLYKAKLDDPANTERRFPVDRRKLERLIIAGRDDETAENFFERIMKMTDTVILWPSKLKIGAKSKKDPQVKVVGTLEAVNKARDMILDALDTKTNRVTLKINIPNGEHSHVIGKEGANIKKVHHDTQCHIHFPDSNRSNYGEKSDQVSITGLIPAVEFARGSVRELQPVVYCVTLPLPGHMAVDSQSPDMLDISATYSVSINIKIQPHNSSMLITVRSTMLLVEGLKLAIIKIIDYFMGEQGDSMATQVMLYVEIPSHYHKTIIGMDGSNLQNIMHDTCTSIQFPDLQSRYHSNQLTIIGTLNDTLIARQRLIGCLPVTLLFDITDENEQVCSAYIGELMQSLDIYICMKPKAKQFTHSIIIKSIEQNMDCVYEARQKIMEVSNNVPHRSNLLPPDVNPQTTLPSTLGQVTEETNEEVTTTSSEDLLISSLTPPIITETNEVASLPPTNNQFLQSSLNKSQGRLTVKSFVDYEKRKEKAEVARKAKVNPNNTRYPSNEFTGDYFSWSMPPVPKEATKPVLTINSTPNGLDSISRKNFAVLMQKANMEREQTVTREKNIYHDIKDLSSLLLMLGLEKYEANFAEEEVDFDTFLTMNEDDLKEVGVLTLGARRKLQIAISELRKLKSNDRSAPLITATAQLMPSQSQSGTNWRNLAPSQHHMNMSHSVRF